MTNKVQKDDEIKQIVQEYRNFRRCAVVYKNIKKPLKEFLHQENIEFFHKDCVEMIIGVWANKMATLLINNTQSSILHLHASCRLLLENADYEYHAQILADLVGLMQYVQRSYKDEYASHAKIFAKLYEIFESELAKNKEIQR